MKLGAESKNVLVLAVLLPLAGYLLYTNVLAPAGGGGGATPASQLPQRGSARLQAIEAAGGEATALTPRPGSTGAGVSRGRRGTGNTSQEWVPRVGGRKPEERADPAKVDPALRLDLLARLQRVTSQGGERSLFDFSAAPVKLPADVKIPVRGKKGEVAKVEPPKPPEESKPAEPAKPVEPPPPPIPLKFYGFVTGEAGKRAFFKLGEDELFLGAEGQLIQSRYKIVRIGLNAAVVEDTRHKDHRQSLPLEEIPANAL